MARLAGYGNFEIMGCIVSVNLRRHASRVGIYSIRGASSARKQQIAIAGGISPVMPCAVSGSLRWPVPWVRWPDNHGCSASHGFHGGTEHC